MRFSEYMSFLLATAAAPVRRERDVRGKRKLKQTRKRPKTHLSIESAEGQLIFPEHLPPPTGREQPRAVRHTGPRH